MKKTAWITLVVLLLLAAGGAWWWTQRQAADAVQYRTAKIERGPLSATVSASGAVNPVTQVSVGTQVSGQIKDLYVDFNSEVKAGQLIAVIDPETFEYRVRQSQADVDAARAAVLTAQANVAASRAGVSRARTDNTEAQRDYERKANLVEKQFIAQSEGDKARALVNTTSELVKAAEAQMGVTEAQVKSAQANVAQREAALAQARIDLSRTQITSPVNGIVIKRAIEKGQTVAASLQAPELFVIAQNLQDMQVDASIDESDVGRIRLGQRATFTVDAFPGQTFDAEVQQVRKAAQTVANVVTYIAVVRFSNTGGRLLPGMTANVRVVTESRESVLKIPNAALRVRIAGVEPANAASAPARGPAAAASTSTSDARGWSLFSRAFAQAPGGGQGGGLAAMRERLVSELNLNADQQAKLDAITQEMRPKFAPLREMDEAQRGPAREKLLLEMRGKINAILDAGQKTKYAQMAAQAQARAAQGAAPGGPSGSPGAAATPGAGARPSAGASSASNNIAANPGGARSGGPSASASRPVAAAPGVATPGAAAPGAPPPGGPGGQLQETRNRLVAELQLAPAQVEKLDAIYADIRPKFGALRELPQEERGKARERIMADTRARIAELLTPEQKTKYQVMLAEAGNRTNTRGRIFLMGADGKPVAYNVRLGISDGTSTELIVPPNSPMAEFLKEGADIIIGTVAPANAPSGAPRAPAGPRMAF